ncbi:MAG: tripartite tricarboxylate transporter TctB family protein [Actinomycetales bacterium]|nr:tripartite tricarboxylate transporter TctB family protein [Actinomycetales bacterium]
MSSTEPIPEAGDLDALKAADEGAAAPGKPSASRRLELVTAIGACAVFAIALYLARSIPIRMEATPGQIDARFWPTTLAVIGLLFSLARLVVSLASAPESREDLDPRQAGGLTKVFYTLLATVLFIALWSVGDVVLAGYRIQIFPVAMALFLAVLLALHGARGWKAYVFFPIPLAVGTFLLFGTLLRIPL